jgi:hypothetical protein
MNTLEINQRHLTPELYETECDTLIVQSGTGTGKTYNFYKYVDKFDEFNVISIFAKRSLGKAHLNYADKKQTAHYTESGFYNSDKRIKLVCINSITKLGMLTKQQLSRTIIYIDEISLFLQELTHNDTLANTIGRVYGYLRYIITHCKKLIVSQAEITPQVYKWLKIRGNNTTLIINKHRYNAGTKFYECSNASMLNKMENDIKNKRCFTVSTDSIAESRRIYGFIQKHGINENDIILINSENEMKDDQDFNNKYVVYSPSIIYGVDISLDNKQNHYSYITGCTLNPSSLFQQAMRCRNLDKLYVCDTANKKTKYIQKYKNYEDCKTSIDIYNKLYNNYASYMFDEDTQELITVSNSSFEELFYENDYRLDIEQSQYMKYFKKYLVAAGFVEYEDNDSYDFNNLEIYEACKDEDKNKNENDFNDYINGVDIGDETSKIKNIIERLKLPHDVDVLNKYKDIICDQYELNSHYNFIKSLNTLDNIESKVNVQYDVLKHKNKYVKMHYLLKLMDKDTYDNNDLQVLKTYDIKTDKIKTLDDLKQKVALILKNLIGVDRYEKTMTQVRLPDGKRKRITKYKLNKDVITHHIDLLKYRCEFNHCIDKQILQDLNIEYNDPPQIDHGLDAFINDSDDEI